MVRPDYSGFDVEEAMERSIAWKSALNRDAVVSSRIGRKIFWQNWLQEQWLRRGDGLLPALDWANDTLFGVGSFLMVFDNKSISILM